MKKTLVNQIFQKFEQLKVIVLGDAMVDTYLWGKIERISPEAPIPIVTITDRENRLGGCRQCIFKYKFAGRNPLYCFQ